jgi:hypothetical protein
LVGRWIHRNGIRCGYGYGSKGAGIDNVHQVGLSRRVEREKYQLIGEGVHEVGSDLVCEESAVEDFRTWEPGSSINGVCCGVQADLIFRGIVPI